MPDSGPDDKQTPMSSSWKRGADRAGLIRSLANANVAVLAQDVGLTYLWAENPPRKWRQASLVGCTDTDIFPPNVAAELANLKSRILNGGDRSRVEVDVAGPEGTSWFELWLDPIVHSDGSVLGIITTATEITEQRLREQTLRALLREVSHRSKNLLAIIQSIASQTGRHADTIEEFLARFRGRLQSLSSSQDLVTSSNWRGADLSQLISGQVARYCEDPAKNLVVVGDNPYLNPNAALHVGLALHELAVNSVSFGALSSADGAVKIEVHPGEHGSVELVWSESLSRTGDGLERRHFGTIALERVVPASINGSASLTIEGGHLSYRLTLPAESFQFDEAGS